MGVFKAAIGQIVVVYVDCFLGYKGSKLIIQKLEMAGTVVLTDERRNQALVKYQPPNSDTLLVWFDCNQIR